MLTQMRKSYFFELLVRRRCGLSQQSMATAGVEQVRLGHLHDVLHAWVDGLSASAEPYERQGLLVDVMAKLMTMPKAAALPEYRSSFLDALAEVATDHAKGVCHPGVLENFAKSCVALSSHIITAR